MSESAEKLYADILEVCETALEFFILMMGWFLLHMTIILHLIKYVRRIS